MKNEAVQRIPWEVLTFPVNSFVWRPSRGSYWEVPGCPIDFLQRLPHSPGDLMEDHRISHRTLLHRDLHTLPGFSLSFLFQRASTQSCTARISHGLLLHRSLHTIHRISWPKVVRPSIDFLFRGHCKVWCHVISTRYTNTRHHTTKFLLL